jgi:hypothetical protein
MTTMLDAKLRSRVEKMIALAEDAANENEAAVAMAKAQQILLAHNLSLASFEVTAGDSSAAEPIERPYVVDFEQGAAWRTLLLDTIARGNLCYTVKSRKRSYVFGTPGNVEDVLVMFDWLAEQAQRLAHETAEARKRQHLEAYGERLRDARGFKNSFHSGFQHTIRERLDDSRQDFDRQEQTQALVVVEQDAKAAAYSHFDGKLRKGRTRHASNVEGYRAGMAAGNATSMNRPRTLAAGPRQLGSQGQ